MYAEITVAHVVADDQQDVRLALVVGGLGGLNCRFPTQCQDKREPPEMYGSKEMASWALLGKPAVAPTRFDGLHSTTPCGAHFTRRSAIPYTSRYEPRQAAERLSRAVPALNVVGGDS
jgi:hypothetical protein